jgi:hypothetical protein
MKMNVGLRGNYGLYLPVRNKIKFTFQVQCWPLNRNAAEIRSAVSEFKDLDKETRPSRYIFILRTLSNESIIRNTAMF